MKTLNATRNKGFTLIELMIVVAIIVILFSIVAGAVTGGKALIKGDGNVQVTQQCINGKLSVVTEGETNSIVIQTDKNGNPVLCQ